MWQIRKSQFTSRNVVEFKLNCELCELKYLSFIIEKIHIPLSLIALQKENLIRHNISSEQAEMLRKYVF